MLWSAFTNKKLSGWQKYSIIAAFTSASSVYQDHIQGTSVVKHPRFSDRLTGIFNKNRPQPKFDFIWNVRKLPYLLSGL